MRINTNVAALTALESNANTNKNLNASLEKLSSGLRINKAADDASGMAIADKLRTQASSITQGISNGNSAVALIQIADKAMAEQTNILDVVKTKLIQAATDTTTDAGRDAIRKDITKLLEQFDMIAAQTNYNGKYLLQASSTNTAKQDNLTFQLGEESGFDVTMEASNASNTTHLGGGSVTISHSAIATAAGGDGLDNNIGQNSSQRIVGNEAVTIATIDIANTGAEIATSGIDITLQGNLAGIEGGGAALKIDFRDETQAVQDAVASIVGAGTGDFDAVGRVSVAAGANFALTDSVFDSLSNVRVSSTAAAAADVTVIANAANDFTVTNNAQIDGKPLLSNLNINASAQITGGKLLEDLKNLTEDGLTNEIANSFMATVDEALTQVNGARSDFGSSQNQIESSLRNMQTTRTNLMAAESVIRDVDYAAESANFNKTNIIAQAGTYAISQANNVQQNVMKLLQ